MKKNFLWIVALLAALALVFTGCPGGGDEIEDGSGGGGGGNGQSPTGSFWLATDDTGEEAYPNNKKTLIGEVDGAAYVHIFFEPHNLTYTDRRHIQLTIEFTIEGEDPLDFMWQCAYDDMGVWSRSNGTDDYINLFYPGEEEPILCRPARIFTGDSWGWTEKGEAANPKPTQLNVDTLKGICIQIPVEQGENIGVFTLVNFKMEVVSN